MKAIMGLAIMPQKCPPVADNRLAIMEYRKLMPLHCNNGNLIYIQGVDRDLIIHILSKGSKRGQQKLC